MPGSFNDMFGFLTSLMTTHADLFQAMGERMFKGFAVILISWFGVQNALSAASGGESFRFDKFATLLMTISFGFGMITYYNHPIPGFGISFYHLIVDQGLELSNQLNHSMVQEVWDRLTGRSDRGGYWLHRIEASGQDDRKSSRWIGSPGKTPVCPDCKFRPGA